MRVSYAQTVIRNVALFDLFRFYIILYLILTVIKFFGQGHVLMLTESWLVGDWSLSFCCSFAGSKSLHCKKSWRSSTTPAPGEAGQIQPGVWKSFRNPWRQFYHKYRTFSTLFYICRTSSTELDCIEPLCLFLMRIRTHVAHVSGANGLVCQWSSSLNKAGLSWKLSMIKNWWKWNRDWPFW